jgi:hypothetical protein
MYGLWLSMMSILKYRDFRGLNATGALVFLTFPTATGPPYPPLQLPLLSLALYPHQLLPPETNSGADKRTGKEPSGIASRGDPARARFPGLGFYSQSPPRRPGAPPPGSGVLAPSTPSLFLPSSSPLGGRGVKIRRRLGLFASPFVGKEAPTA